MSSWLVFGMLAACGGSERFPLREPLWLDTDMRPVSIPCEARPSDEDKKHVACAPEPYVSPLAWDGANNMVFRPISRLFAVEAPDEALNVNAFDEVPDSAWFTNRIGREHPERDVLLRGACTVKEVITAEGAEPGSWVIDRGKSNGASLGFRVRTPGGGKYMFKNDSPEQPERATAASAIGAAIYHAVGFNTSCEQIVYFEPTVLHLNPGLTVTDNSGMTKPFDAAALENVLSAANRRGAQYRMQASAWLPGYLIGPFRYEFTRHDDPNDAIPHDDRRDLRGARVLAAWLNHFDAREQNSMDSWIASRDGGEPDSSPGYVRHYYIDTSDSFGSEWSWDPVSRRLGRSYLLDWADLGSDFVSLGIPVRPWERVARRPNYELFGYFDAASFDPDAWKNEYPNPAFSRATERDNAWMARILSHFDRSDIEALVSLGEFTKPEHAAYLAQILELRLQRILARYFAEVSPLAEPRVNANRELCVTDLAARRHVWPTERFVYRASATTLGGPEPRVVRRENEHEVCISLPRSGASADLAADAAERYMTVSIHNGASRYPLVVHLYEVGGSQPYRVVGLERPESED
ncbi:MAG: hypothetical protein ABW321_12565 [Polyangiales bacterium]